MSVGGWGEQVRADLKVRSQVNFMSTNDHTQVKIMNAYGWLCSVSLGGFDAGFLCLAETCSSGG